MSEFVLNSTRAISNATVIRAGGRAVSIAGGGAARTSMILASVSG